MKFKVKLKDNNNLKCIRKYIYIFILYYLMRVYAYILKNQNI